MGNQIVHFEILGDDAAATKRFYTELFDWKLTRSAGRAITRPSTQAAARARSAAGWAVRLRASKDT